MPTMLAFFFIFSLIPNMVCQIIPLRFNRTIDQSHHTVLDIFDGADYHLTPEAMWERMSLSSFGNETNTCEEDFRKILHAALNHETWAMKILDAWGKPLPSGVLLGNMYWVGNYDECLQDLYSPNNKSFISQPFNTQYCKYTHLLDVSL